MFGWRRRSEGFEWREYVRTTVLVRRADRQRMVGEVRDAAVARVIDTRDRGVAAGRAGVETVWQQVCGLATATAGAVFQSARFILGRVAAGVGHVWTWAGRRTPGLSRLWRAIVGRMDNAVSRIRQAIPDFGLRLPFDRRFVGGAALGLVLIVVGGPMLNSSNGLSVARLAPATSTGSLDVGAGLSGRATAVSGDLLRVDGQLVRLAGIDAPESNQSCLKLNGRRWSCGAAARSALARIVRGKPVACETSGLDPQGRALATCKVSEDLDIAAELVRGGHVFAQSGYFSAYRADEETASAAKLGVWQGTAVRPTEWREQIWQDAKRAAPEGCPIKGYTRATNRLYALPWAQGYDRARVRTVKGDRWFCSEDEARAAGFKPSDKS